MGTFAGDQRLRAGRAYLGLAILCGAALFGLTRDFQGVQWIAPVYASAVSALALAAILRSTRLAWPARASILGFVGLMYMGLFVAPEVRSTRALLPNPIKVLEFARQAWDRSLAEFSPVMPDSGFLLLAAGAAWLAVMISEPPTLSGRPILAAAPWIGLFAYTSSTGAPHARMVSVLLFTAAFLAFLTLVAPPGVAVEGAVTGQGFRLAPGTAILGSIAIGAALVAPRAIPGYGNPGLVSLDWPGPTQRVEISPIVQIRPRLTASTEVLLFEVRAEPPPAGTALYWRLLALDRFNGEVWHSSADYQSVERQVLSSEPFRGSSYSFDQEFLIHSLGGPWMPAAYQPVGLRGIRAAADPQGSALVISGELRQGRLYFVSSRLPNPTVGELEAAQPPTGLEEYRSLSGISEDIRRIAVEITKDSGTPFRKVVAISEHLRGFTYDQNVEAGHARDQLLHFLTVTKAGYCEQFAASMAALVRAIGLPARVAVGFLAGDYDPEQGTYSVTTRHAHAWTEVYFQGVGWVPFEPTPRSIAAPPGYALSTPVDQTDDPPAEAGADQPGQEPPVPEEPSDSTLTPADPGQPGRVRPALLIYPLLAAFVLLAGIPAAKFGRRRLRYRRASSPSDRAVAAFREFEAGPADLARPRRRSQTPLEFTEEVTREFDLDPAVTAKLLEVFTLAAYAPEPPDHEEAEEAWRAALTLQKSLWQASGFRGKSALLISPRSLLRVGSSRVETGAGDRT